MNMSFITIQMMSEDSRFPMNGKLLMFGNVHSLAFSDGILFINYEDSSYQINEEQIKLENVSNFFVS